MDAFKAFQTVDIRVGKIIDVQNFPEARKPTYKIKVDLGPDIGVKKSTAQLTTHYTKEILFDKLVLCVVNLPLRQIGPAISEVLILGVPDKDNETILIQPEKVVPIGGKLY